MTDQILSTTLQQMLRQDSDNLSFSWQGGEPTLMGLPFFQVAIEYEMTYGRGQTVSNALQTNGIALDRSWAAFLARYRFLVGLSLDGPEHVHDHYRLNLAGKGTWRTVHERAQMLLDAGVSVNALVVVTDYSVRYPKEIYSYLKELGLVYMQFIPCYERDPSTNGMPAAYSVPPDAYGEFLCAVFDEWLKDFSDGKPTTSVRFFESLVSIRSGLPPNDCTLLSECGTYLVVEHNGDIYSCDFYVTPDWKLGNVNDDLLVTIFSGERQREFGRIKALLPDECLSCKWLSLCQGGCPKDRAKVSYFCPAFRRFFKYSDSAFKRLVNLGN